jgi:hypothetical protein
MNVSAASSELVPASDLRRLLWAKPQLQDATFEVVEARIDKAEKNIAEAVAPGCGEFLCGEEQRAGEAPRLLTSASAGAEMNMNITAASRVIISWEDPDVPADADGPLLEHDPLARP